MKETIKDVSLLEHPEPLEIMTNEIKRLCDDEYIKMIHRKEPLILYEILDSNGFFYYVTKKDKLFHIFITKQINKDRLLTILNNSKT